MSIDVRGGTGGMVAAFEDLDLAAARLFEASESVALMAARVARLGASGDAVGAGVAGIVDALPVPWLRSDTEILRSLGVVEARLAEFAGPSGAGGEAAELAALAASVRSALTVYRAAEAAVTGLVGIAQDEATLLLLEVSPVLIAIEFTAWADGHDLGNEADIRAFDHPWLADVIAGGADRALRSLGQASPFTLGLLAFGAMRAGRPFPPRTPDDAVATLAQVASVGGYLDEASWRVSISQVVTSPAAAAPRSVSGLLASQADLDSEPNEGRVRVVEVPQPDGSSAWILQVPGTQVWGPRAGANPFDLTSDVQLMAQDSTLAAQAAADALDAAMASAGRSGSGDVVMLAGHSQGGIIAASLASSRAFLSSHRVTNVVMSGAPIARFPIPADVSVLSLEHAQDPVARLDGSPNPDRRNWTTVTRDLRGDQTVAGRASAAHAGAEYQETARYVDREITRGDSASLSEWARGATQFLRGDGARAPVVRDYAVSRVPASAASQGPAL